MPEDYSQDVSEALDDAAEEINSEWRFFALTNAPWSSRGYDPVDFPSNFVGEILAGRLATKVRGTRQLLLTIAEYGERTRERLTAMDAVAILRPEHSTTFAEVYEFASDVDPAHVDADGRWYWLLTQTMASYVPIVPGIGLPETLPFALPA